MAWIRRSCFNIFHPDSDECSVAFGSRIHLCSKVNPLVDDDDLFHSFRARIPFSETPERKRLKEVQF